MRHFFATALLPGLLGLVLLTALAGAMPAPPSADPPRLPPQANPAGTARVHQLLALAHHYVMKPGQHAGDLDAALRLSQQAQDLSRRLGYPRGEGLALLTAARAHREQGDPPRGRQRVSQALALLARYGSREDLAEVYMEQAAYYSVSRADLRAKISLYDKSIGLLERSRDTFKLADALKYRGDLHQLQSNNEQALSDLRRALTLFESIGYPRLQEVYDLLGFVSSKTGDYEAGIRYGLQAMKKAEAQGDSGKLAKLYSRLGITYKELDQPDKALYYLGKSLRVAQTQRRRTTIIHLATTISAIIEEFDRVDPSLGLEKALDYLQALVKARPYDRNDIDCRVAVATCLLNFHGRFRHQYARAQPYCDTLEQLRRANLGEDYDLYLNGVLIPFYVHSRQYGKARALLAGNEQLCRRAKYMKELSINHLWWFKLDSAQANFPAAIRHYQRYTALTDSLLTEKKNQTIAQLEVRYRTEQKEHSIQRLTQRSKMQQIQLQKAATTRNFIAAGAVMLVLLLVLSYNRYRLKQQSNRLLQAQHEELQAQQEVLQAQQREIHQQNDHLSELLTEKDSLLDLKDSLLGEKDQLLTEKEWLLKEIHHRVKNNLQIIMSLLNSQAASLQDQAALSAIQESQHRVQTMALIHQKLYQSEGVARIPMKAYIHEVVTYLSDSYCLDQPVGFRLDVAPVELDVTQAVPLGLILNEAVTNAFKYAFPGGRPGTVCLSLKRLGETTCQLTIADDGVGLPAGYDPSRSRSLGMRLMHGFSQQLGGELTISSAEGLCITLVFEEESLGPRAARTASRGVAEPA
jgi:two-component sensor histidine kinase